MIPHRPDLKPPAVPQPGPGPWRIIDTRDGSTLESWQTEYQAEYFALAGNDHEERNGRGRPYVVRRQPDRA